MREILFRGYSTALRKWFEGDLIHSPDINHPCICNNDSFVNVSKKSIGLYTGLTDKNGIKIFEGDIVAGAVHWLERMKNGVVVFRDGSFGLIWHRGEVEQFAPFTSLCNVEYEVIGNIHDNSDLLEGGEADA